MVARKPIFKMTFLKSTSSGELIPCKRQKRHKNKKPMKFNIYVLLAIVVHRDFF